MTLKINQGHKNSHNKPLQKYSFLLELLDLFKTLKIKSGHKNSFSPSRNTASCWNFWIFLWPWKLTQGTKPVTASPADHATYVIPAKFENFYLILIGLCKAQ